MDPSTLAIDEDAAVALGRALHERYVSAEPYPHVVIDDAFPEDVLEQVREEVSKVELADRMFESDYEFKKSQLVPERLSAYARNFFYTLNSRGFLRLLEEMTGVEGLITDPYFGGGGVHTVGPGGFLKIHADFNVHEKLKVERRLNVLVYLNRDWKEDYGGCFEIWDREMTTCHAKLAPIFNRMVVFSTGSDTMHGNPDPVAHPEGQPRRSLALYYYTATWDETRRAHTTKFRGRPGLDARSGVDQKVERIIDEVLPPLVNRQVKKVRRRLGV